MARLIAVLVCLIVAVSVHAGWVQETRSITQLITHFMGKNSGLGNGTWPKDSGFPSTVNFILRQSFRKGPAVGGMFRETAKAEYNDIHCGATWMPTTWMMPTSGGMSVVDAGVMPTEWDMCEEGRNQSLGVRFRFKDLREGFSANPTGFGMEVGVVG